MPIYAVHLIVYRNNNNYNSQMLSVMYTSEGIANVGGGGANNDLLVDLVSWLLV